MSLSDQSKILINLWFQNLTPTLDHVCTPALNLRMEGSLERPVDAKFVSFNLQQPRG